MRATALALATFGAVLAALGQICFRLGAEGRAYIGDFVNVWIGFGLVFYGAGTAAWIKALSTTPLTIIYPFTALTYVLVNVLGVALLGEKLSINAVIGTAMVLLGLLMVTN